MTTHDATSRMRGKNRSTDAPAAAPAPTGVFSLFWEQADWPVRRRLALALVMVLLSGVAAALAPVALKYIVDSFATDAAGAVAAAPLMLIAGYVFAQFAGRLFGELRFFVDGAAEKRLNRRLSARLFAHVMALPMRFHADRRTGALSQTLSQGLLGYRMILMHLSSSIVPVFAQVATMTIVLVQFGHPGFMAIMTVSLAAYAAIFAIGVHRIAEPSRAVSSANVDASAVMTDSFLNYETVKCFSAEARVLERYDSALARTEARWQRFYTVKTVNGVLAAIIFALTLAMSAGFAARNVALGSMTPGDFVLINTYVLLLMRPLEMLGMAMRDIAQARGFIEQMLALFREEPEPGRVVSMQSLRDERPAAPAGAARLAFDDVLFSYPSGNPVLKGVSFEVEPGQTVAVVGPSGAGKSSLVRLLMRLYEPDSGRILLDGAPISDLELADLRSMIALVPQDTALFHESIGYNIGFGRDDASPDDVRRAAEVARVHDFVEALPDGYETIVGERGLKLSGGERQRVAIARAALKRPRMFVFDESTSSLDTRTEQEILGELVDVSRGVTTLIIAHRLSTIVHADAILVLDGGRITERGSHSDLLAADGVYAALWRAQQKRVAPAA